MNVFQVHPVQASVFLDGNRISAPLLHDVCHLPLSAWSTPEVCQQGGKHMTVGVEGIDFLLVSPFFFAV